MKIRSNAISTTYINGCSRDEGLVLDFNEAAQNLPEGTGADYIHAKDWRLGAVSSRNPDACSTRRKDAETRVIALCDDVPQEALSDCTFSSMIVKRVGDMHLALPEILDFTLSRVNAAAFDALKLYGPELFEKAKMTFIVQRTDVESGEVHRPHVAKWHDHLSGGENTDMVYLFHNSLGTENRLTSHNGSSISPVTIIAPDYSLSRVGGEITHRPQLNEGDELRREWGALIINIEPAILSRARCNGGSFNNVLVTRDDSNFEPFKEKANQVLDEDTRLHVLPESKTLIDYVGVDIAYT